MIETKRQRVVLIVQARMGATRLPGKPLLKVLGKPLLAFQLERLQRCKSVDEIVVATTTNSRDQAIVDLCQKLNVSVFRGSEEDVLDRYYRAATEFTADVIVRSTADCPLIDPAIVDHAINFFTQHFPSYAYVSNTQERTYPRGMDVEVFSYEALKESALQAKLPAEREHVTFYMYEHPEKFTLANIVRGPDESKHRWTVDTLDDFVLIAGILQEIYPQKPQFTMTDVLDAFKIHPDWFSINSHIQQKELKNG